MEPLDVFELEVFDQTSSYCEVRLAGAGSAPRTRGLDRAAVDELIELVERNYTQTANVQWTHSSPRLRALGGRLAEFVDGDERWLAPIVGRRRGVALRITGE